MKIYCLDIHNTDAVSVGNLLWFPGGKSFYDFTEAEILLNCRPRDPKQVEAFESYIEEQKNKGAVRYMLEHDLPEGCRKRSGFWEGFGMGTLKKRKK